MTMHNAAFGLLLRRSWLLGKLAIMSLGRVAQTISRP